MLAINIIINIIILINLTLIAGVLPLLERKYLSLIQRRVGPTFVGYKGRLQFIADALKMFLKSCLLPSRFTTNSILFYPAIVLAIIYLFWLNSYWNLNIIFFELEYNFVFMIIISSLLNFFIILTAIYSGNTYSLFSGVRAIILMFCLELLLGVLFLNLYFYINSFHIGYVFIFQHEYILFILFFSMYSLLIIITLLEINRAPFDLTEAENELISGYHVELGGFFFGLFYLGEYFHLFFFSLIIITIFTGLI